PEHRKSPCLKIVYVLEVKQNRIALVHHFLPGDAWLSGSVHGTGGWIQSKLAELPQERPSATSPHFRVPLHVVVQEEIYCRCRLWIAIDCLAELFAPVFRIGKKARGFGDLISKRGQDHARGDSYPDKGIHTFYAGAGQGRIKLAHYINKTRSNRVERLV